MGINPGSGTETLNNYTEMTDAYGTWHVYDNHKVLVTPSQEFETQRTPSLETLRSQKDKEISDACKRTILSGFDYNGSHYGLDAEDQINLEALKNNVVMGLIPEGTLEYYVDGGPCTIWNNTDFLLLYNYAMNYKIFNIRKRKTIKEMINAATEQELEAITWDMVIS